MKKYLEVYVGSRGCLEGVELKEFENIEEYLVKESEENMEGMLEGEEDESYREEIEGSWSWDKDGEKEIYYLGLGDEECKYYIDMEGKKFLDWKEKNEINLDYGCNNIDSKIIRELV